MITRANFSHMSSQIFCQQFVFHLHAPCTGSITVTQDNRSASYSRLKQFLNVMHMYYWLKSSQWDCVGGNMTHMSWKVTARSVYLSTWKSRRRRKWLFEANSRCKARGAGARQWSGCETLIRFQRCSKALTNCEALFGMKGHATHSRIDLHCNWTVRAVIDEKGSSISSLLNYSWVLNSTFKVITGHIFFFFHFRKLNVQKTTTSIEVKY